MSDSEVGNKTVITVISKISERKVASDACLVVIYGMELGKRYKVDEPIVVIGRSSQATIQVDHESVSRSHCKLINTGQTIMLRDNNSTNGTYVNDELVDEYVLRDGDFVKIGRCIFKFLVGSNIENAYHEEIYRLTTVDGLTQIYNKRYFTETLEREIGRALRYRRHLSLIMFDIDHFKEVNDNYGHLAGDSVLRVLAATIKSRIRREDVFARYGGEEFAIILPEIERENAAVFAEKVRILIERTIFEFDALPIPIRISVGVASLNFDTEDCDALVQKADEKLYEAKEAGRNRVMS